MDKAVSKRVLRGAGLPVVDFRAFTASEVRDAPATLAAAGQALGFPLFVKPANTGSSVGVARVTASGALGPAVRAALAFQRRVILERARDPPGVGSRGLGNA